MQNSSDLDLFSILILKFYPCNLKGACSAVAGRANIQASTLYQRCIQLQVDIVLFDEAKRHYHIVD